MELEKIESIPGVGEGGKGKKKEKTVGRFTELIGIGPGTLWVPGQDGSGEEGAWGDIPEVSGFLLCRCLEEACRELTSCCGVDCREVTRLGFHYQRDYHLHPKSISKAPESAIN